MIAKKRLQIHRKSGQNFKNPVMQPRAIKKKNGKKLTAEFHFLFAAFVAFYNFSLLSFPPLHNY